MSVTECRKVLIVGDSIIKDVAPIAGVTLKAYPGASIGYLTLLFSNGDIDLTNYDFLIIHVGTNNIDKGHSFGSIVSDYGNLVAQIRKKKPSIRIIMSSILPRPKDHSVTEKKIFDVNKELRTVMAKDMNFHFIRSYRMFSKFGTYRRYLYAKKDQGLHLNTEGSNRLRYFFLRVISTLD